jgi:MFS transporter, putative metabolite:H+ symporter
MNLHDPQRVSAAGRLDRLPIFSFHRRMMWLLSFCFFFELGDINTFAYSAPAIRAQWGISIATIGLITSGTFFGMFLGAATGGWFADLVGRKRGLTLSVAWFSAFSLLNAFAWNPASLFFARLMTGIGLSAMTAIGITYIAEIFPARVRGTYQGWVMGIGLCGIPFAALVSRFLVPAFPFGWRLVFVWGALALLFPLVARELEESPRWYEKRGKTAEADAILQRLEAAAERETGAPLPPPLPLNTIPREGRYTDLFAPRVRSRTVMLVVAWIFQTLGFYGFSAWVPTLLVEHGFKLVDSLEWATAMQIGGVPGAFVAALLSDRWQRKYWITLLAVGIAVCGILYGLTFQTVLIVIFGGLMTMLIQAFAPLLYAYTAECFPTEIRSTGTGFTYGIGRLSNAAGPLVIAFLFTSYGYTSVFAYIAACWLVVAAMVAAMGPLTRGRTL